MRLPTDHGTTLDDLRAHRDAILRLAEQYGATNVRVFGSVARGEATPNSDVDLLVSLRDGASLYELSGLWQALPKGFSPRESHRALALVDESEFGFNHTCVSVLHIV